MKKKLVLMISSIIITSTAANSEIPDFCKSGAFTCRQVSPNYIVAYPVNKVHPHHSSNSSSKNIDRRSRNGTDSIEVDLTNLTWSAYGNEGELMGSGRVSGGKDYCPDIGRECQTVTGNFTIYKKGGADCKSTRFPVGRGGAPMPYCMFFHGGYSLHGSNSVPDYNASHGCVRMSTQDARWLNESFVQEGLTKVHVHY